MSTIALVSDFDGTITKKDFFYYAVDNLLSKEDMKPWDDYENGLISHFEALKRIFSKIRLPKEDFDKFILTLPIEDNFVDTYNYCKNNNIPYYIVSAGANYYINLILKHLNITDSLECYVNESYYTKEKGLVLVDSDSSNPFFSSKYGLDKKKIFKYIKSKHKFCIFAGDGKPDIEPARIADVVFARGKLFDLCNEFNIPAIELKSYLQILEYLKNA